MAIYKTVSVESAIINILRRNRNFKPEMVADCIVWIGEALEHIGFYGQTEKIDNETIEIESHRGEIPVGLVKLNQVLYGGRNLPYGSSNFLYSKGAKQLTKRKKLNEFNGNNEGASYLASDFYVDLTETPGQIAQDIINKVAGSSINSSVNHIKHSFIIVPDYFKTSFSDGCIEIDYERFVTDERGYPVIPDNIYFRDAVIVYCEMMLARIGVPHPVLKYQELELDWGRKRAAAELNANLMDKSEFNAFRNSWVRLVQNIFPERNYYDDFSIPENIRL